MCTSQGGSRKTERRDFAKVAQRSLPKEIRAAAFAMLDGKCGREVLRKHLVWANRSQARIDSVRPLYGFTWSTDGLADPDG